MSLSQLFDLPNFNAEELAEKLKNAMKGFGESVQQDKRYHD